METNNFITSKYPGFFNSEYKERSDEQVMEKGKTVHKITYKTIKPSDRFKGYKASDFDLQVLISVGALDSKGECYLTGTNPMIDADMLEYSMDNTVSANANLKDGGNE